MSGAFVMAEGVKRPGMVKVGYAPKSGRPTDDQGRLILVWQYGWPPGKEPAALPAEDRAPEPIIITRGIRAGTTQGRLI